MKVLTFLFFSICSFVSYSQAVLNATLPEKFSPELVSESHIFELDIEDLRAKLIDVPQRTSSTSTWKSIKLPTSDGTLIKLRIAEASIFSDKMQARYPEIRSYQIKSDNDEYLSGRISITPLGLSGLIFSNGGDIFYEPLADGKNIAYKSNKSAKDHIGCDANHEAQEIKKSEAFKMKEANGGEIKTYRIAVASTIEFSAKHNNNLATINSKINEYITELNAIYERDIAITFELTANNDDIIFFNSDDLNPNNKLGSSQSVISSIIPAGEYEIGHTFYEISYSGGGYTGSGVASLGVVCFNGSKARGWSGCGGNYPTSFWMDIFAHEVGHQFDAPHTFYGTTGNCSGNQRSIGNGVEPGSGTTLMSYSGSCGASGGCPSQNISNAGSVYFHSYSIGKIQNLINTTANCYQTTSLTNSPPVVSLPSSVTIPKGTAFELSATATDPDGDNLLLGWEEIDTDNLNLSCPNGEPNDAATSTTAPLFRSFEPTAGGGTRIFPQLSDLTNNTQTLGEILPQVGRDINMRFTARAEAFGGVTYDDMTVTVAGNSGPFEVLTANSGGGYQSGQSVNVQWDVANTNAAPVSCSNVNILFSFDGGLSYPTTLASNTPNDGSQTITMPSSGTSEGRIKIEGVGNIFFDINNDDILITSDCNPVASEIVNDEDRNADVGDPSLVLDLMLGGTITQFSGILDGNDPSNNLIAENEANGNCTTFGNFPKYERILLEASTDDTYSFVTSAGSYFEILNIYENEYIPGNQCSTWLQSNASWDPSTGLVTTTNPTSIGLNEGGIIELVLSGFSSGNSGAFTVNISSSNGGEMIQFSTIPSGFSYQYVTYSSTGIIKAIEDIADLSDASIFSSDTYTVEGIMLFGTPNLSSYVGQNISNLRNAVLSGSTCGQFSNNDVTVTINGCTPGTRLITSAANNNTPGTLSYEINNSCPTDMIMFSSSLNGSTINISSELNIQEDLDIMGLGINNLTFSGNNTNRIFNISEGATLSIFDLALKNGFSSNDGGAFINEGAVQLTNILFENNKSGAADQAFTNNGEVTIKAGSTEIKE